MTPKPLLERPLLPAHLQFYWNAFWELLGSRRFGMSVGPIPISEVEAYARYHEIDEQVLRGRLLRHIRAMDSKYLELNKPADEAIKPKSQRPAQPLQRTRRR